MARATSRAVVAGHASTRGRQGVDPKQHVCTMNDQDLAALQSVGTTQSPHVNTQNDRRKSVLSSAMTALGCWEVLGRAAKSVR